MVTSKCRLVVGAIHLQVGSLGMNMGPCLKESKHQVGIAMYVVLQVGSLGMNMGA